MLLFAAIAGSGAWSANHLTNLLVSVWGRTSNTSGNEASFRALYTADCKPLGSKSHSPFHGTAQPTSCLDAAVL
eukprot:8672846-Alexandrium_andersonii.AAC.1